jgi:hypothetical protein
MARPTPKEYTPGVPPSLSFNASVEETLDRAAGIFDTTSAYFLQRRAKMNAQTASALRAAH